MSTDLVLHSRPSLDIDPSLGDANSKSPWSSAKRRHSEGTSDFGKSATKKHTFPTIVQENENTVNVNGTGRSAVSPKRLTSSSPCPSPRPLAQRSSSLTLSPSRQMVKSRSNSPAPPLSSRGNNKTSFSIFEESPISAAADTSLVGRFDDLKLQQCEEELEALRGEHTSTCAQLKIERLFNESLQKELHKLLTAAKAAPSAATVAASGPTSEEREAQHATEMAALREQIATLMAQNAHLMEENADLTARLAAVTRETESRSTELQEYYTQEMTSLHTFLESKTLVLTEANETIAELETELGEQRAAAQAMQRSVADLSIQLQQRQAAAEVRETEIEAALSVLRGETDQQAVQCGRLQDSVVNLQQERVLLMEELSAARYSQERAQSETATVQAAVSREREEWAAWRELQWTEVTRLQQVKESLEQSVVARSAEAEAALSAARCDITSLRAANDVLETAVEQWKATVLELDVSLTAQREALESERSQNVAALAAAEAARGALEARLVENSNAIEALESDVDYWRGCMAAKEQTLVAVSAESEDRLSSVYVKLAAAEAELLTAQTDKQALWEQLVESQQQCQALLEARQAEAKEVLLDDTVAASAADMLSNLNPTTVETDAVVGESGPIDEGAVLSVEEDEALRAELEALRSANAVTQSNLDLASEAVEQLQRELAEQRLAQAEHSQSVITLEAAREEEWAEKERLVAFLTYREASLAVIASTQEAQLRALSVEQAEARSIVSLLERDVVRLQGELEAALERNRSIVQSEVSHTAFEEVLLEKMRTIKAANEQMSSDYGEAVSSLTTVSCELKAAKAQRERALEELSSASTALVESQSHLAATLHELTSRDASVAALTQVLSEVQAQRCLAVNLLSEAESQGTVSAQAWRHCVASLLEELSQQRLLLVERDMSLDVTEGVCEALRGDLRESQAESAGLRTWLDLSTLTCSQLQGDVIQLTEALEARPVSNVDCETQIDAAAVIAAADGEAQTEVVVVEAPTELLALHSSTAAENEQLRQRVDELTSVATSIRSKATAHADKLKDRLRVSEANCVARTEECAEMSARLVDLTAELNYLQAQYTQTCESVTEKQAAVESLSLEVVRLTSAHAAAEEQLSVLKERHEVEISNGERLLEDLRSFQQRAQELESDQSCQRLILDSVTEERLAMTIALQDMSSAAEACATDADARIDELSGDIHILMAALEDQKAATAAAEEAAARLTSELAEVRSDFAGVVTQLTEESQRWASTSTDLGEKLKTENAAALFYQEQFRCVAQQLDSKSEESEEMRSQCSRLEMTCQQLSEERLQQDRDTEDHTAELLVRIGQCESLLTSKQLELQDATLRAHALEAELSCQEMLMQTLNMEHSTLQEQLSEMVAYGQSNACEIERVNATIGKISHLLNERMAVPALHKAAVKRSEDRIADLEAALQLSQMESVLSQTARTDLQRQVDLLLVERGLLETELAGIKSSFAEKVQAIAGLQLSTQENIQLVEQVVELQRLNGRTEVTQQQVDEATSGQLSAYQTEIVALTTKLATLKQDSKSRAARSIDKIRGLQAQLVSKEADIEACCARIEELEGSLSEALVSAGAVAAVNSSGQSEWDSAELLAMQVRVRDLETERTQLVTELEGLQSTVAAQTTEVLELRSELAQSQCAAVEAAGRYTDQITDLTAKLTALKADAKSRASKSIGRIKELQEALSAREGEVAEGAARVSELEATLRTTTSVTAVVAAVSPDHQSEAVSRNELHSAQQRLVELDLQKSQLVSELEALQSTVARKSSEVLDLRAELAAAQTASLEAAAASTQQLSDLTVRLSTMKQESKSRAVQSIERIKALQAGKTAQAATIGELEVRITGLHESLLAAEKQALDAAAANPSALPANTTVTQLYNECCELKSTLIEARGASDKKSLEIQRLTAALKQSSQQHERAKRSLEKLREGSSGADDELVVLCLEEIEKHLETRHQVLTDAEGLDHLSGSMKDIQLALQAKLAAIQTSAAPSFVAGSGDSPSVAGVSQQLYERLGALNQELQCKESECLSLTYQLSELTATREALQVEVEAGRAERAAELAVSNAQCSELRSQVAELTQCISVLQEERISLAAADRTRQTLLEGVSSENKRLAQQCSELEQCRLTWTSELEAASEQILTLTSRVREMEESQLVAGSRGGIKQWEAQAEAQRLQGLRSAFAGFVSASSLGDIERHGRHICTHLHMSSAQSNAILSSMHKLAPIIIAYSSLEAISNDFTSAFESVVFGADTEGLATPQKAGGPVPSILLPPPQQQQSSLFDTSFHLGYEMDRD